MPVTVDPGKPSTTSRHQLMRWLASQLPGQHRGKCQEPSPAVACTSAQQRTQSRVKARLQRARECHSLKSCSPEADDMDECGGPPLQKIRQLVHSFGSPT